MNAEAVDAWLHRALITSSHWWEDNAGIHEETPFEEVYFR